MEFLLMSIVNLIVANLSPEIIFFEVNLPFFLEIKKHS